MTPLVEGSPLVEGLETDSGWDTASMLVEGLETALLVDGTPLVEGSEETLLVLGGKAKGRSSHCHHTVITFTLSSLS